MMSRSIEASELSESTSQAQIFRPMRSRAYVAFGISAMLYGTAVLIGITPLVDPKTRADFGLVCIIAVPAIFLAAVSTFLLVHGIRLLQAHVSLDDRGIRLFAQLQRQCCRSPYRRAELGWPDVQTVATRSFPNYAAPGGVQVDYYLTTAAGTFVFSNINWGQLDKLAALIGEHKQDQATPGGLPPVPPELPPPTGFAPKLLRGFGWVGTICGWLLAACLGLALVAPQNDQRSSLAPGFVAAMILIRVSRDLRRYGLPRK